ncbi:hypothetical protein [Kosakonia cowanii]|uniref:hypothetical protein n=1 Tax=Kosakonia cowanii TaxID=208223 RepID=UPI0028953185|nr:hypothetical protein [Kosakonia cowanii]MDT3412071.1 hypothetical protein [Atlantibacter sp. SORGH_AS_0304]
MMKTTEEAIHDLQCRALAYEVIFQSIFSELPQVFIERAAEKIEGNFKAFETGTHSDAGKAKLDAAKAVVSRIMGTKI